jgi:hypothetical protein
MTDTEIKRGPGRPPRAEQAQQTRRRRESLGVDRHLKLHVPEDFKDKSFEYRWVNDQPGRLRQLTVADDWDVVSTDDPSMTKASEGTVMKRAVDKASGDSAVLLRKPKEFYDADQKEAKALLDAKDEDMRRGAPPSPDGLAGSEAYVPGGRNIVGGR